jgi:CDP-glycerol glycerophosphotransferase
VYQHNDLKSETEKVIDGKFKHKYILPRVFSLYRFFDKIISVSLQTMHLNAENLKEYAPTNKFDYVNNQIDIEDINNKINENEEKKQISISNKKYYVVKKMNKVSILENKDSQDNTIQLITIGRLSPEKDHQKLFLALHKFIKEHPNVDIQLKVLGSGVLNDELNKSIDQLELRNNVNMMGQVTNPYTYLSEADCFILSSNHEGQPMVLLEELALKKRVIATDITGNRSVLEGTNGILVENSIDGLKEGIVSLLEGKIKPNTKFDIEEYNEKAISRFYKIVCGNQ